MDFAFKLLVAAITALCVHSNVSAQCSGISSTRTTDKFYRIHEAKGGEISGKVGRWVGASVRPLRR